MFRSPADYIPELGHFYESSTGVWDLVPLEIVHCIFGWLLGRSTLSTFQILPRVCKRFKKLCEDWWESPTAQIFLNTCFTDESIELLLPIRVVCNEFLKRRFSFLGTSWKDSTRRKRCAAASIITRRCLFNPTPYRKPDGSYREVRWETLSDWVEGGVTIVARCFYGKGFFTSSPLIVTHIAYFSNQGKLSYLQSIRSNDNPCALSLTS